MKPSEAIDRDDRCWYDTVERVVTSSEFQRAWDDLGAEDMAGMPEEQASNLAERVLRLFKDSEYHCECFNEEAKGIVRMAARWADEAMTIENLDRFGIAITSKLMTITALYLISGTMLGLTMALVHGMGDKELMGHKELE